MTELTFPVSVCLQSDRGGGGGLQFEFREVRVTQKCELAGFFLF